MDEHGHIAANICEEDDGSQIAKDVLGGKTEMRTNLALAIISPLAFRYGQGLAAGSLGMRLDDILFPLGVINAIPRCQGHKCDQKDERVEILRFAEDNVDQAVFGRRRGGRVDGNI